MAPCRGAKLRGQKCACRPLHRGHCGRKRTLIFRRRRASNAHEAVSISNTRTRTKGAKWPFSRIWLLSLAPCGPFRSPREKGGHNREREARHDANGKREQDGEHRVTATAPSASALVRAGHGFDPLIALSSAATSSARSPITSLSTRAPWTYPAERNTPRMRAARPSAWRKLSLASVISAMVGMQSFPQSSARTGNCGFPACFALNR